MRRLDVTGGYRVFAGEDALHAGRGEGALRVHRDDLRMRPVGAHEMAVELAGRVPVRGILARARDETKVFYAFAVVMVMGFVAHWISFFV